MKYKVGDLVVITESGRREWYHNDFGKGYGRVKEVTQEDSLPYSVVWEGGMQNSYRESNLEFLDLQLENV